MAWKRSTLRAAASLTNGTNAEVTITGMRGIKAITVVAKATDANTLSAYRLEHKSLDGNDAFFTVADAAETGDAITSQTLNASTSGSSGSVGRRRRYVWGETGCPWNTLKVFVTAGGTTVAGLSIDVVYHTQGSEGGTPTEFAD
jgi:hypothetical protein